MSEDAATHPDAGTWDYRLLRHEREDGTTWYSIHEVAYGDNGEPKNWTLTPARPTGDSTDDVMKELGYMMHALTLPILEVPFDRERDPVSAPSAHEPVETSALRPIP